MTRKPAPNADGSADLDKSLDILGAGRPSLEVFFRPRNAAVIGATETAGSVGRTLMANFLRTSFGGAVYPVNPKRSSVMGVRAYARVADLPEPPDLAVIVVPAPAVPEVVGQCAVAGARGAIVISAGFREVGPAGAALEKEVLARAGSMRLVGPNCLGVMCPPSGLNATFAHAVAKPGRVAFLSQSGALCTAVLDWSLRENVGFSAFVSAGSMSDVGWGDLIDYLGHDAETNSILIYMESIGDARAFLSAARETALSKPVIVLKVGRSEAAARAAASHTGALAGSDAVLDAALARCGALRVDSVSELFALAGALAKQPRPKGPRLAVVTNAGGPGVLAADALSAGGGRLAELSPDTVEALNGFLPAAWSRANPVDVLGDADPGRYAAAMNAAARDPNIDGLLVLLTPQAMTDPTATAEKLAALETPKDKPVLASWMGGDTVLPGRRLLGKASIPVFAYPDDAARTFCHMWRHSDNLRALYETPSLSAGADEDGNVDAEAAGRLLARVRGEGRALLAEHESKDFLSAYGLPVNRSVLAATEKEAAAAAEELGGPVAVKLHSFTVTHKAAVGGVRLDVSGGAAARAAFRDIRRSVEEKKGPGHFQGVTVQPMAPRGGLELILGLMADPQFGPVLLFGSGGSLVEIYKDRAVGLPPLNTTLARRLMEKTRIFQALADKMPEGLPGLEKLLVRFSRLAVEQPWVKEIDINPLLAGPRGFLALDARVVLHDPATPPNRLPRPAVRPYPSQYARSVALRGGGTASLRPIRPEDEPAMIKFHQSLSERTVYMRYLHPLKLSQRVSHERLARICFVDYDREMVLAAEREAADGGREILAVGRLSRLGEAPAAEFALLVADAWQGKGLGTAMLKHLLEIAAREGLGQVLAEIHPENDAMQKICSRLGFRLARRGGAVRAEIEIGGGSKRGRGKKSPPPERTAARGARAARKPRIKREADPAAVAGPGAAARAIALPRDAVPRRPTSRASETTT